MTLYINFVQVLFKNPSTDYSSVKIADPNRPYNSQAWSDQTLFWVISWDSNKKAIQHAQYVWSLLATVITHVLYDYGSYFGEINLAWPELNQSFSNA